MRVGMILRFIDAKNEVVLLLEQGGEPVVNISSTIIWVRERYPDVVRVTADLSLPVINGRDMQHDLPSPGLANGLDFDIKEFIGRGRATEDRG